MNFKISLLLLWTSISFLACPLLIPVSPPHMVYPGSIDSYGRGAYVDVNEYDTIYLRPDDNVFLYPLKNSDAVAGTLEVVHDGTSAYSTVTHTDYDVTIYYGDYVWPGDMNGDGHRDVMDLQMNADYLGQTGADRAQKHFSAGDPGANRLQVVPAWSVKGVGPQGNIGLQHADANGDGLLDGRDRDLLAEVLTPLFPPQFLQNVLPTGFKLQAKFDRLEPASFTGALTAFYRIEHDDPTVSQIDVRGVVFSRPVSEQPNLFTISHIFVDLLNSDMIPSDHDWISLQKFWPELSYQPDQGTCAQAESKVLDVAVFNTDTSSAKLSQGHNCFNCGVTLADILRPNGAGTITINQHITNGLIFTTGGHLQTVTCSLDSAIVDLDILCTPSLVVQDDSLDFGTEPNRAYPAPGLEMSPDIWLRKLADNDLVHQTIEHKQPAELYVRVHNPGCDTFRERKTELRVYLYSVQDTHWVNPHLPPVLLESTLQIPEFSEKIYHAPLPEMAAGVYYLMTWIGPIGTNPGPAMSIRDLARTVKSVCLRRIEIAESGTVASL